MVILKYYCDLSLSYVQTSRTSLQFKGEKKYISNQYVRGINFRFIYHVICITETPIVHIVYTYMYNLSIYTICMYVHVCNQIIRTSKGI